MEFRRVLFRSVEEVVSAAYGPDVAGRPPDGGETHRAADRDPDQFRITRIPLHDRPQRGNRTTGRRAVALRSPLAGDDGDGVPCRVADALLPPRSWHLAPLISCGRASYPTLVCRQIGRASGRARVCKYVSI